MYFRNYSTCIENIDQIGACQAKKGDLFLDHRRTIQNLVMPVRGHNLIGLWFLSLHWCFLLHIGGYFRGHVGVLCVVVCIADLWCVLWLWFLAVLGSPSALDYHRRWQAPVVPAELPKIVICVCTREKCFFRPFMGLTFDSASLYKRTCL